MQTAKEIHDQQFIQEILKQWKPNQHRTGQLVQRRSAVWHYSVAISDKKAISWSGIPHETGHMDIHDIGDDFSDTLNVVYFPKEQVLKNLLASVIGFHNVWQYGWGWNCEHWARLVATGEPRSYQVSNAFFGILTILGLCYRPEAIQHLLGHVSILDQMMPTKCATT